MKEQVTDLEKIPADQMTDKRLVCKLYLKMVTRCSLHVFLNVANESFHTPLRELEQMSPVLRCGFLFVCKFFTPKF